MKSRLLLLLLYFLTNIPYCKAQITDLYRRKNSAFLFKQIAFRDSNRYDFHPEHRISIYSKFNAFYNPLTISYSKLNSFPKNKVDLKYYNQNSVWGEYETSEISQTKIIINYKAPNVIRYLLRPNRHLYIDSKTLDRGRPKAPYYMMENRNRYDFLYMGQQNEGKQP